MDKETLLYELKSIEAKHKDFFDRYKTVIGKYVSVITENDKPKLHLLVGFEERHRLSKEIKEDLDNLFRKYN